MVSGILLLLGLLYAQRQNLECRCMNFLARKAGFLSPLRAMATSAPANPLVGTTLSKEALNVPLTTHTKETTTLQKLLAGLPAGYKGLVLFLFPSAGTPGCTRQACSFAANHKSFKDRGYEVFGLTSSERTPAGTWTEKHKLTFTTLVDRDMKLVDLLDCRRLHLFVHRSHLVLSREGKVLALEKGVNAGTVGSPADASAARVLELLEAL